MMLTRRTFLGSGLAAVGLTSLPALGSETTTSVGGHAFGSYWRLTVPQDTDPHVLVPALTDLIEGMDRLFSPYRAGSVISAFNASQDTDWQPVPRALASLLGHAHRLTGESEGAFDPSVGPIVHRFGFGPITARRTASISALAVKADTVRKSDGDLTLDLCGIAKGYALDRLSAHLVARGHRDFLFDLGGEIAARGSHPAGRPWQVAVDRPGASAGNPLHALTLGDAAVATSGDGPNGFDFGGRRYGHIIDPRTAAPATGTLASVSVRDLHAARADGWATALFAMGLDRGAALAQARGIAALFQFRDGKGFSTVTTGGFADTMLF